MKIYSIDRKSWISILPKKDEAGYSSFSVEAFVEIGHGRFEARNSDIQWLNLVAFAKDLSQFVENRSIRPKLEGTYDTVVYLSGNASVVHLEFAIGDAYYGNKTHTYLLKGSFELDQEYLLEMVQSFESMQNKHVV